MQGSENIQETEAKGKVLESVVTERDLGVFVRAPNEDIVQNHLT